MVHDLPPKPKEVHPLPPASPALVAEGNRTKGLVGFVHFQSPNRKSPLPEEEG
jgi:hypothetical protein